MLTVTQKNKLWKAFKSLGQDALKLNHYELADTTELFNPDIWKEFLKESDVEEMITTETAALQDAEFRKILLNTQRDNSAGRAQLINAMLTAKSKTNAHKEGPVIIYSYVPLNEEQKKASNIHINSNDTFKK